MTYTFVIPKEQGCSLEDYVKGECPSASHTSFQGEYVWGYQTYRYLKDFGLEVALSFELKPDTINLAHGNVLRTLGPDPRCFSVSLQADYPQYPMAHYHIVQNMDQVSEIASYIPHWPLPRQIPRDPGRTGMMNTAYQGARKFTDLDEQRLQQDLKQHGISFEILDLQQWEDLSNVDVLVGIRHFGRKKYKRKPPTKLINAWLAGIPFIGGWDSAYSQIGIPGQDYIRVSSYQELLSALLRFKTDPDFYSQIMDAGNEKARYYTNEAISAMWKELLETDVTSAYEKFRAHPVSMIEYQRNKMRNSLKDVMKYSVRQLYRIPGVKRMRERYYDPSK